MKFFDKSFTLRKDWYWQWLQSEKPICNQWNQSAAFLRHELDGYVIDRVTSTARVFFFFRQVLTPWSIRLLITQLPNQSALSTKTYAPTPTRWFVHFIIVFSYQIHDTHTLNHLLCTVRKQCIWPPLLASGSNHVSTLLSGVQD